MIYVLNTEAAPAVVQPRHASEAGFQNARCRGQGCGAVGKAMLEGYCNKCYVKEQSARLTEAASRGSTSPPPVLVSCSALLFHCSIAICDEVFIVFYLSVQLLAYLRIYPLLSAGTQVASNGDA